MSIKRITKNPDIENIIETIKNDSLNRNEFLKKIVNLIMSVEPPYTIAIDGGWGSGKTFLLKQIELLFNENEEYNNLREKVFGEQVVYNIDEKAKNTDYNVYYFDCWKYDYDSDPLLSILRFFISKGILKYKGRDIGKNIVYQTMKTIPVIGNVDFQKITRNTSLQELNYQEKVHKNICKIIDEIAKNKKLVFLIDELDRCKPTYAISFLERIKHYFDDDRIIFVFASNLNQLQHTIKNYYGEGYDGFGYIDRFFDFKVNVPIINSEKIITSKLKRWLILQLEVTKGISYYFNMSLRTIEHYCDIIKIHNIDCNKEDPESKIIASAVVLPIMIGVYLCDINLFEKLISGKGSQEFSEIFFSLNIDQRALNFFVTLFGGTGIQDAVAEIYQAYFGDISEIVKYGMKIVKLNISVDDRLYVQRKLSMLI